MPTEKDREYHREYSRNWYYKNKKVDPNPPPVGMKKCRKGHIHGDRSCKECARIYRAEHKKQIKEKAAEWKKNNMEKIRAIENKYRANAGKDQILKKQAAWRAKNLDKVRLWSSNRSKKSVLNLTDNYVSRTLGLRISDIPVELMEAKREALRLKHLIKEIKK